MFFSCLSVAASSLFMISEIMYLRFIQASPRFHISILSASLSPRNGKYWDRFYNRTFVLKFQAFSTSFFLRFIVSYFIM